MASIISVTSTNVTESASGVDLVYTVTLSQPSLGAVSMNYRTIQLGTADIGEDVANTTGVLTFAPGETLKTISVRDFFDRRDETDESVILELFNPVGGEFEDDQVTLRETAFVLDEPTAGLGPNLALQVSSPVYVEGDAGTTQAVFTIDISRPSATPITLNYTTKNGSAVAGQDYQAKSGSVTIPAGLTTAQVSVPVFGDNATEISETFDLVVTPTAAIANGAAGAVGTATILDDDASNSEPSISVEGFEVVEAASSASLIMTLHLSEPSLQAVSVNYRTLNGETATAGEDYAVSAGIATFAPGQTTLNIAISDFFDRLDEVDEAVVVEFFDPSFGVLAGNQKVLRETAFIRDDPDAGVGPNLALDVSDPVLVEGDSGTQAAVFELTLSRPSQTPITLNYTTRNGDAVAGSDYTAKSGTVTFAAGQTKAFVSITTRGDNAIEGTETFDLVVTPKAVIASGPVGAVGTATLLGDDAGGSQPTISLEMRPVSESASSASLQAIVTLSEPSLQSVTVAYRTLSEDSADAGEDYAISTGTVTFAPGETSKLVNIADFFDRRDETDEAVTLELFNPTGGVLEGGAPTLRKTGFILDDPDAGVGPNLALHVSSPTLVEGDSGSQRAVFEIQLSEPPLSAITLNYRTINGSAVAGQDYTAKSGTISFAAGQTKAYVSVLVSGDRDVEVSEYFSLAVTPKAVIASGAIDAVGEATIMDDDSPDAQPVLNITGYSAVEGASSASIEYIVTLSAPATQQVSVDYATIGGTATAGADYSAANGTLVFAVGETSKTIRVTDFFDRLDESDESVVLALRNPVNARLEGDVPEVRETAFLRDDPDAGLGPNIALHVSSPVVEEGLLGEGRVAVFDIELSEPAPFAMTLNYSTADISAVAGRDYVAKSGSINFVPGQTRASVEVKLKDDLLDEGTETFSLSISTPLPSPISAIGSLPTGVATIQDDEVIGTDQPDRIDGTRVDDAIFGLDGDDRINALRGDDQVFGGNGNDDLIGSFGNDLLDGGDGNDLLRGGNGSDLLLGGKGSDDLRGQNAADILRGGNGADDLLGGRGTDTVNGGKGKDIVNGGKGNDLLIGGKSADVFQFDKRAGSDTIADFELGKDIIQFTNGIDRLGQLDFDQRGSSTIVSVRDIEIEVEDIRVAQLRDSDNFDFI
ncbi:MAG: Calx-beta domain-containing protein [Pseudomonadota bacterium]